MSPKEEGEKRVVGMARKLLRIEGLSKKAVFHVFLLGNEEMNVVRRKLSRNPSFRGAEAKKIKEERRVSVLAFPEASGIPHPETKKRVLGEVYVNKDFTGGDRRAEEMLLIHGFLHLLGYRHGRKGDRMRMEAKEKELARRAGN